MKPLILGSCFLRLPLRPHVVIEAQEVPDILELAEPSLFGGATYRETWLGIYLESGTGLFHLKFQR